MQIKNLISKGLIPSATKNARALQQVQSVSEVFNRNINRYAKSIDSINNDTSRTRAEKASLYEKISKKMDTDFADIFEGLYDGIHSEKNMLNHLKESAVKSGDKLVNLQLAIDLRQNKDKASQLLNSDLRYVQAASEFPASYYGIDANDFDTMRDHALLNVMPELRIKNTEIQASEQHVKHLTKYYDALKGELNILTDHEALKNRVDADNL
jgi:hypothetical protein